MKKFARHRGVNALKALCAEKGVQIDTTKHDRDFSDYVRLDAVFDGTLVMVIYSVFNGTFFGSTAQGVSFNESSAFDDEPWFAAILDLLYLPLESEVTHWLRQTIGELTGRVGEAAIAAVTPRMLVSAVLVAPTMDALEAAITARWGMSLVIASNNSVADVAKAIVVGSAKRGSA